MKRFFSTFLFSVLATSSMLACGSQSVDETNEPNATKAPTAKE